MPDEGDRVYAGTHVRVGPAPPPRWSPGQRLYYHGRVEANVRQEGEGPPCGAEWVDIVFADGTVLTVMHDEVTVKPRRASGKAGPVPSEPAGPPPPAADPPSQVRESGKRSWPCDLCDEVARGPQGLGAHKRLVHGVPGKRAMRLAAQFRQAVEVYYAEQERT